MSEQGEKGRPAPEVLGQLDEEIQNTEDALTRLGKVFEKVDRAKPILQERAMNIGTNPEPLQAADTVQSTPAQSPENAVETFKVGPKQAISNQVAAAALGALVTALWTQYVAADGLPPDEIMQLLPGIAAWAVAQIGATAYNNRKA